MTGAGEHGTEPVWGLPGQLPPGERLLWQGRPRFRSLARRAFHLRTVALYFGLLIAWKLVVMAYDGRDPATGALPDGALLSLLALVGSGLAALALLAFLAWLTVRTTAYSITSRRVVMRYGIALPMTLNLPFAEVANAAVRDHGDGTGDIPLQLGDGTKVAYVHLWPHARPWRLGRPEPMLRAVAASGEVAALLARAMLEARAAATPRPAAEVPAIRLAPAPALARAA